MNKFNKAVFLKKALQACDVISLSFLAIAWIFLILGWVKLIWAVERKLYQVSIQYNTDYWPMIDYATITSILMLVTAALSAYIFLKKDYLASIGMITISYVTLSICMISAMFKYAI